MKLFSYKTAPGPGAQQEGKGGQVTSAPVPIWFGCAYREIMAHIRQSRPDSGLGFHVKVVETFNVVPSSLGSGPCEPR